MIGSWSEWPVLVVYWSEASSQLEVRKVRLLWSLPLSCWPSTYPRRRGAQDNSARPCVQATARTGALVRRLGSARLCSTPGCSSASSGGERSQLRSSALTSSFAAHWLPHWECLKKGMIFSENSESIRCHCLPSWILLLMLGMCVRD